MAGELTRSNKPIFWSLFGAGGMFSALTAPALVLVVGILIPLGLFFSPDALGYEKVLAFAKNPLGKLFLLAVIVLYLFHGCHRAYHVLHDFGVHVTPGVKAAFHGFAGLGSIAALWWLSMIGF
jgi:succinate dehydrogenase subunit D